MNTKKTVEKQHYEAPIIGDIRPVTVVYGDTESVPDGDSETGGNDGGNEND